MSGIKVHATKVPMGALIICPCGIFYGDIHAAVVVSVDTSLNASTEVGLRVLSAKHPTRTVFVVGSHDWVVNVLA